MRNIVLWMSVVGVLVLLAFFSNEQISENKLKADYYDLIVTIGELFKDHTELDGEKNFYNRSYNSKDEIHKLLEDRVTEDGLELVISSIFENNDDKFVYKKEYQDYLVSSRDFSSYQIDYDYYNTVRDTILNPALRLINFDLLEIEKSNDGIKVQGENVKVRFYPDDERQAKHHQYARYGFPSKDYLDISLTFKVEDGTYLLDNFKISSNGM